MYYKNWINLKILIENFILKGKISKGMRESVKNRYKDNGKGGGYFEKAFGNFMKCI